jgi:hypothetical protein
MVLFLKSPKVLYQKLSLNDNIENNEDELEKIDPNDISLSVLNKDSIIEIGVCEDVGKCKVCDLLINKKNIYCQYHEEKKKKEIKSSRMEFQTSVGFDYNDSKIKKKKHQIFQGLLKLMGKLLKKKTII